jgi:hypothetical protein
MDDDVEERANARAESGCAELVCNGRHVVTDPSSPWLANASRPVVAAECVTLHSLTGGELRQGAEAYEGPRTCPAARNGHFEAIRA